MVFEVGLPLPDWLQRWVSTEGSQMDGMQLAKNTFLVLVLELSLIQKNRNTSHTKIMWQNKN